jgi:hypothetical protein
MSRKQRNPNKLTGPLSNMFNEFCDNAKHHKGNYLIEYKGEVLKASTPRDLFQLYKDRHERTLPGKA